MQIEKVTKVVKKNWDEIGIALALGHIHSEERLAPEYEYVVQAIRRSTPELSHASYDEIREYIRSLDEDQIPGFVNNIKGIAHEVYYVEAENEDGDQIYAYLYSDTSHPDWDVHLVDKHTGEEWDMQLKATDDPDYAQEAIEEHGADRVVLTEELAEKMGVESSGISNEELEADVEYVTDKLLDDHSLWDYVPHLTAWSLVLILAELTKRWLRKEITTTEYVTTAAAWTGAKAVKVAALAVALSIPVVAQVTSALLIARALLNLRETYSN